MAISVKKMAADKANCTVTFGMETADVSYRPRMLTNERMRAAEEAEETGDLSSFYEFLSDLIIEWDVLDDDGDRLPASPEVMNQLPLYFMGRVFREIMENANHLGDTPKVSKGGLRQKANLDISPTGTGSFS